MIKLTLFSFFVPLVLWSVLMSVAIDVARADSKLAFGGTVRDQVGVNIHFTDGQPGEMDELSKAGFGFIRMDFVWSDTEKSPGVYDFHHYDKLLADLESRKMRVLWILDYGNPLYDNNGSPSTDAGRNAFASWAAAAVTHFKGHHILWEMWNEPNGSSWIDNYIKLALATGNAIRTAEPNETYIGPAESGTDPGFLEATFKGGLLNYWKAVSVHPYRSTSPETSTPEIKVIQDLIKRYEPAGKQIPLLSGEWGYCVIPAGNTYSYVESDEQQAAYFDREILTNMANGLPLSIWYDWRNDSDNPAETEGNFGLVRFPYRPGQSTVFEPKPSYTAAKTFLTLLGSSYFSGRTFISDSTTALLFTFSHRHDRLYVAYTTSPSPEQVTVSLPMGGYKIEDFLGHIEQLSTCDASGLPLILTGDPQFIIRMR